MRSVCCVVMCLAIGVLTMTTQAAELVVGKTVSLFDGKTLDGWTTESGQSVKNGWVVEEGCIHRASRGGNIYYQHEVGDFELSFEWKIVPNGNNGLKYRVRPYGGRMLGCEYQIYGEKKPAFSKGSCGALYALYEPNQKKKPNPPGQWNTAKIVAHGPTIEHWLNGEKIVAAEIGSPQWNQRLNQSKFSPHRDFARNTIGRIMLTDHGSKVWYRNMKLTPLEPKPIPAAPETYVIKPLDTKTAEQYHLEPKFFDKTCRIHDILIATSDQVPDFAIRETAYQFDMIMSNIKPDVAQRIRDEQVLCILLGHKELTSDVPQFATDKTGKELDFYNWRQRGFLAKKNNRPTVVFAEEDVMEYEGGMQLESILVHEFGHVIHSAGFNDAQQKRLTAAFERARAQGIWNDGRAAQRFRRVKSTEKVSLKEALIQSFPEQSPELVEKCLKAGDIRVNGKPTRGDTQVNKDDKVLIFFGGPKECYAHKNRAEYWAEGVQCWYDTNRTMDHDHNHITTRGQLKTYDRHLAALCREVLQDSRWRFVSPRMRAGEAHLRDYNPSKAPKVVDPPHIETAAYDYYDKYWASYWERLAKKHNLQPADN